MKCFFYRLRNEGFERYADIPKTVLFYRDAEACGKFK